MGVDFAELRRKMVDGQIRTIDVTDIALLEAFLAVPRERFVPSRMKDLAYLDSDLEITSAGDGPRRFMMRPGPLARLIQLAAVAASDVVLVVGAGSGYASAVLSRLSSSVIALESQSALVRSATEALSSLGCDNVAVVEGALKGGYPSEAPYDVILIEGAVDEVPATLFDQLREGGRLIAVEGHGNAGVARLYVRQGGNLSGRRAFNAAVPALPGFERAPSFEF